MNERQYIAFLGVLVIPALVTQIVKLTGVTEADAIRRLYRSEFYAKLCDEKLKLWHYSPVLLGDMFVEYERTGVVPYPEGI